MYNRSGDSMKKTILTYGFYLFFYSVGGFFLERIINILFLGSPYNNSFLYGPYQPLYGSGIVLTIIVYDLYIKNHIKQRIVKIVVLTIFAILLTGLVETITGEFLEALTGIVYWNYGLFFPCSYPYSCFIPTSIFGVISVLVILFIHPFIEQLRLLLKDQIIFILLVLMLIDAIIRIGSYL